MRAYLVLFLCFLLFACQQNRQDRQVFRDYEWLPPEAAANSNPYIIPRGSYQGYYGYPIYDNDSTYIPPRGYGLCGGASNIGCE